MLLKQVVRALNCKDYHHLILAKEKWSKISSQEYLNRAFECISNALQQTKSKEDKPIILGNLAYIESLQGNKTQSEMHLREALSQDGKMLYQGTLEDIVMHPIDIDTEFKQLLDRVWDEIKG